MSISRRKYDAEFKRSAVELSLEAGRTVSEVAEDLGISENMLWRWRKQYREAPVHAFPGNGRVNREEQEMRGLRQHLADVTMERDILKKALAIFSKTPR